jgi:transposase
LPWNHWTCAPAPTAPWPAWSKLLIHDGIGIWLAARRLHQGKFIWPQADGTTQVSLSRVQLDALVLGLPWRRMGEAGIITLV